jgi:diguanylate cyclase (GGDEF)-like protein
MELISSPSPRTLLSRFFFGSHVFTESEEYLEFRFKFLIVLMLAGALLTALVILGTLSDINPIGWEHGRSMIVFTLGAVVLWLVLRGRPHRFKAVGYTYEALSLWEATSSTLFVPMDELRVLWFFTNIPCVFILLGQRTGWVVTLGSIALVIFGNAHLSQPYSPNAVATASLAMLYFAISFHAYTDRSLSYFKRMRDFNLQLQDLASHDPLTGVMNARAYYANCDQLIRLSQRDNQIFSVLFVDLDHFKRINDTYGHAAGDHVLRTVAHVILTSVRGSDVVGRIGGEEFSVFLPNTDLAGAIALAEKLRAAIEDCHPTLDDVRLTVTASIGVASKSFRDQSMVSIQQSADLAMYEAKKQGRNRVSTVQDRLSDSTS